MTDSRKIEGELYIATYGGITERSPKKRNQIWKEIKDNKELLADAIQVIRNKWNDGDTLKSLTISEAILMSITTKDHAPEEIYEKLIEEVYRSKDIARITFNAPWLGWQGNSFLLISLWNKEFPLTKEQKSFTVREALEKVNNNITHGYGEYDIRYYILRNSNWSEEEKARLLKDFYPRQEEYEEVLDAWEWGIVNEGLGYGPVLEKAELYEYSYDQIHLNYQNQEVADNLWSEIEFCRQMHKLRTWESISVQKKNTLPIPKD